MIKVAFKQLGFSFAGSVRLFSADGDNILLDSSVIEETVTLYKNGMCLSADYDYTIVDQCVKLNYPAILGDVFVASYFYNIPRPDAQKKLSSHGFADIDY